MAIPEFYALMRKSVAAARLLFRLVARYAGPQVRSARMLLMVGLFVCAPLVVAAPKTGALTVSVTLQGGGALSGGVCRNSTGTGLFGATVTVVCNSGVVLDLSIDKPGMPWLPTHGGAYRYITQVSGGTGLLGSVDIYSGIGTITALRLVSNVDRDYLELIVGW